MSLFSSLYPIYQHNPFVGEKGKETARCTCSCVWACMWGPVRAGVPDCKERIRSLECKTLLDPGVTFEAKSPAHICPSWVMIQLVAPLEC